VLRRILLWMMVFCMGLLVPALEDVTFAWSYTITAKVEGGNGRVTPTTQKVQPGANANIRIYADLGYHIASILDNTTNVELTRLYSSYTYTIKDVRETHNVIITFAINEYTIKASVSGGHGQVTPTEQVVKFGESLLLYITPDEGYNITGIMDNNVSVEIKNPYVLEAIKTNHNVVVAFTSFTVTASVDDSNGSVAPTLQTIHSGGRASINIYPNEGYMIKQILVNGRPAKIANPFIVGVGSNQIIRVSFTEAIYSIKASSPDGLGRITVESDKIKHGGTAIVKIKPDRGYRVKGIMDNGISIPINIVKDRIELINIKEDHVVTVSFTEFDIDARLMNDGGTLKVVTKKMFFGGTAVIDVIPDPGWKVTVIKDNGRNKPVVLPYTIPNVKEDHFVEFTFTIITFTVTAIVADELGVVNPSIQTVKYGSRATINITPFDGEKITGIMDNGRPMYVKTPYIINSVFEDHTIIITMKSYIIETLSDSENGYIYPPVQYINNEKPAFVLIFPDIGYHIDYLIDNEIPVPITNPYIIEKVTENHAIRVRFALNTYAINAIVLEGEGTIEPTTQVVKYGEKALVKITPAKDWKIESIMDNGVGSLKNNLYFIYYVTEDHNIEVKFSRK